MAQYMREASNMDFWTEEVYGNPNKMTVMKVNTKTIESTEKGLTHGVTVKHLQELLLLTKQPMKELRIPNILSLTTHLKYTPNATVMIKLHPKQSQRTNLRNIDSYFLTYIIVIMHTTKNIERYNLNELKNGIKGNASWHSDVIFS